MTTRAFPLVVAASAAARLGAADAFLSTFPAHHPVTIVAATRGAADDLARTIAARHPATFGMQRLSLLQLAARTAIVALASEGVTPGTWLGSEAVATRAAFEATRDLALRYFRPVAGMPGFPRALARTLQDVRLHALSGQHLAALPLAGPDLAALLDRFEASFELSATADRADLLRVAAQLLEARPPGGAFVLLDVAIEHPAEHDLIAAVAGTADALIATCPTADVDTVRRLEAMGARVEAIAEVPRDDLTALRRFLFDTDAHPPERALDGSLEFFSAPGEGRESVEIARRILDQAERGVRFDQMAILMRSPHSYFGLLEHALHRAAIPAWFDRGTRRPHPGGRAFLALLACAAEQLSAARFAEYLSLGQVPQIDAWDAPPLWAASRDDMLGRVAPDAASRDADRHPASDELETEMTAAAGEPADAEDAVLAGTLRAPWQWEKLLVDAAVIGGDPQRWRRRLSGYRAQLARQIEEAQRDAGERDARVAGLERMQDQLAHLERFALPVVEAMSGWPVSATWGEWLDRFEALAPRVLRVPGYVLRVLADLRPMADVGPIDLDEARRVLSQRLLTVESEAPARRFGRVFVGTPQQARGRSFRVVFVPGLAERMFPQKPREDPLLLDDLRSTLAAGLPLQRQRLAAERLLLQLAAGAASERLFVSYPRIELSESRARVPSFYALELMRAATGRVPDHELLEERARDAGNATLAWPAPPDAARAIDEQEHDLAVLRALIDTKDREAVKGHAHYLLDLNDALRRSVIDRWARGQKRWLPNDGLTRVSDATRAGFAAQRLTARSYSLSALQKFSACPYQFVLAAMYRLQPIEQPAPLQRMDPLTRGSLFHDVQARFLRQLKDAGQLPVTPATIDDARAALDAVTDAVAERAHDDLVPAVERVWAAEMASIRRDLHAWLHYLAEDGGEWTPEHFELAFGRVPGERDARSTRDDVVLEGGFRLRGAIDLIEEHRQTRVLRVTDHKTGRKPDHIVWKTVIHGGQVLQPVLYAMAVEAVLTRPVSHGRLFYCTSAGGFASHPIPLNEATRAAGLEVLRVVDRAIEQGFLAAAPTEEACGRCDFQPVCGPEVYRRVARKPQEKLADLVELRRRP